LFFGKNIFRFDLFVEPSLFRDRFDHPEVAWTLPKAFGLYVRQIHIDASTSSWSRPELYKTAKAGVSLITQALVYPLGTETTRMTRLPPLETLRITYDNTIGGYEGLRRGSFYLEGRYLLDPLKLLVGRKVHKVLIGTTADNMKYLGLGSFGLQDFNEELQRLLTCGVMSQVQAVPEIDLVDTSH
jgi:hypothetical protein